MNGLPYDKMKGLTPVSNKSTTKNPLNLQNNQIGSDGGDIAGTAGQR